MTLAPGTRLGPYEVAGQLGAGGMGEVYCARDARLGRDVAVKILPSDFATDADRRARFDREGRAVGQVNHPNILAILDVGTHGDVPFIVTELLEGETLRERLRAGAIPQRKAIEIAAQVARGLGAAHEKNIVHRDIKPENVFISADGHVKILDFGLARVSSAESEAIPDVTLTVQTASGIVLGTAMYMSPEQARGQVPADARSDIFALGAVLYEMLSGHRPFTGNSYADLISSILRQDPDPFPPEAKVSPALDRIVRRCLEKSPSERFQSARDLAFQLESLISAAGSGSSTAMQLAETAGRASRPNALPWIAAAALVVAAASLGWWVRGRQLQSAPHDNVQFERLTDFSGMEESPALSPDGKSVAFVSDSSGSRQIWIRLLAGGVPLQLSRDEREHFSPRWSPDSASLFYYTPPARGSHEAVVWEISALGGLPRRVTYSLSEADPSRDGKSLAFFRLHDNQIELVRTDRDARNPQVLAKFPSKTGCRQPRWAPDDSAIAFIVSYDRWTDDLYEISTSGGLPRRITHDNAIVAGFSWLPDASGFAISSSRGSTFLYLPALHLWQVSRKGGEPLQLTFGDESESAPDVDGQRRLVSSRIRLNFDIWKFPVDSAPAENVRRAARVTHQTAQVQTPSVSPDGRQLVYLSDTGGHGNLWVLELASGQSRQITFEKDPNLILGVPVWAPDGTRIAYARQAAGQGTSSVAYWVVRPDGSDNRPFLLKASWLNWSPDGRWAYYSDLNALEQGLSGRVLKAPTDGGPPVEVRRELINGPSVSPDGSTLYYAAVLEPVNGLWEYEIRAAQPDSGPSRMLAPLSGHRVPSWQGLHPILSPDGKWLALPLNDKFGTNLWLLSTANGEMHPVTDFGERRTFIARRVAWSGDNRFIYAAVGEGDSDIVMFDGLLR